LEIKLCGNTPHEAINSAENDILKGVDIGLILK